MTAPKFVQMNKETRQSMLRDRWGQASDTSSLKQHGNSTSDNASSDDLISGIVEWNIEPQDLLSDKAHDACGCGCH